MFHFINNNSFHNSFLTAFLEILCSKLSVVFAPRTLEDADVVDITQFCK